MNFILKASMFDNLHFIHQYSSSCLIKCGTKFHLSKTAISEHCLIIMHESTYFSVFFIITSKIYVKNKHIFDSNANNCSCLQILEIDERTVSAIMDEVKNMLDYKVGHMFFKATISKIKS